MFYEALTINLNKYTVFFILGTYNVLINTYTSSRFWPSYIFDMISGGPNTSEWGVLCETGLCLLLNKLAHIKLQIQ